MAWWLAATVLFGAFTALFAVGLPAAFAFLGINIVGAWIWLGQDAGLVQMIRNGVASIASFPLTPIPFFVLMGEVLFHTGVALKAIDAIDRVIWRVPGRLSVVAVVAGTVVSALSGPPAGPPPRPRRPPPPPAAAAAPRSRGCSWRGSCPASCCRAPSWATSSRGPC